MRKIEINSVTRDAWNNIIIEYTFTYPNDSTKSGKEIFASNATEENILFLLRKRYHDKANTLPDISFLKHREIDFDKEEEEDLKLI